MSDPKKESPYANINADEYAKRMQENRKKYSQTQDGGLFGGIKKLFLWWLNIGASFMGIDKKNILQDVDGDSPIQPYSKKHSSGASFKESYRAEPRKLTHEEMLIREMEYKEVKKMTDGKGDKDCR